MQLGTRWRAGTTPPATVPEAILGEITAVETHTDAAAFGASWTLTFLEGSPIAELDLGWEVTIQHGAAISQPFDEDEPA